MTEDTVRILQRLQPEKQYMIEDMIYLLNEMDEIGWIAALDIIRALRKTHKKKKVTVSSKDVN